MSENNTLQNGVHLTSEEIEKSEQIKKRRRQTTAQLPVFRDLSNLLYQATIATERCPRKLSKYTDCLLSNLNDALIATAYANESRGEERESSLKSAIASAYVIRTQFVILERRNVISKDTYNLSKKVIERIIAQFMAWRDYTNRQGRQEGYVL